VVCGPAGSIAEVTTAKQRTLLVALLLRPNEWVRQSQLVDALWEERPPRSAVSNVKTYVWQLRGMLSEATGSQRVDSRPGGYRLVLHPGELDAQVFDELAERGRAAIAGGRLPEAVNLYDQALALWRDEPFDDVPTALVEAEAIRLRERRWSVREELVEARLGLGEAISVIPTLRAMLVEQPLRERVWGQLILALAQVERRAEALAAYQEVYQILDRELGLPPGPGLQALHHRILSDCQPTTAELLSQRR